MAAMAWSSLPRPVSSFRSLGASVQYFLTSYQTLVPLVLGAAGLAGFMLYEAKVAFEPVVPRKLLTCRTTVFGYVHRAVPAQLAAIAIICEDACSLHDRC